MSSVRIRRSPVVLLLLPGLFASYCLAAGQGFLACTYTYSQSIVRVNGHDTPLEVYRPKGTGTFPLVFVLHGSTGAFTLNSAGEPAVENLGEKTLARSCFVVVLPHYLEAIGRKSLISPQEIAAQSPELVEVTSALLDFAETLPSVRGRPVFIFGQSLGGYLSIVLAFRRAEIVAVSEVSGGLPKSYMLQRLQGPRVLISHGMSDTVVPPSEADALARYCSAHRISFDENKYPGESHYLSDNARSLVVVRTIDFFHMAK